MHKSSRESAISGTSIKRSTIQATTLCSAKRPNVHARASWATYVETQLAPTLQNGDVVILDNLSSHKSPRAAQILRDRGAWFLFLPPCSPDLNPIEMAFSKLNSLICKAAGRTYEDLWKAASYACNLFTVEECFNFFKVAESAGNR
ncbi:transposase [Roseibium sp. TrichSKD4]|uniref:transposase n=1 Tax=Roseibium sp. TrichSKD4 TaxID=744980 RepID=UPI001FFC4C47|nr:transposase [Roseibium sp. TrichSKD4]